MSRLPHRDDVTLLHPPSGETHTATATHAAGRRFEAAESVVRPGSQPAIQHENAASLGHGPASDLTVGFPFEGENLRGEGENLRGSRLRASAAGAAVAGETAATTAEDVVDQSATAAFDTLTASDRVSWEIEYQLARELGRGGQGVVFLADRIGAFGVHFRVALKFFQPAHYPSLVEYRLDMARMARMAMRLARLQHDTLLDVFNLVGIGGVQVLVMEWVDGFDLRHLLDARMLLRTQERVPDWRFEQLQDVVVTSEHGGDHASEAAFSSEPAALRLQPGIAVAIVRDCLSGLAALHRAGIVHADVKPANIMIKRTGASKMIDVGSSFTRDEPPHRTAWTPRYAAVEVLAGGQPTPASDLASLGYTLLEMLTGRLPWDASLPVSELLAIKQHLPGQLPDLLPPPIADDELLCGFLARLIAADPAERFASAESANFDEQGAAGFQRQLVKGDLDSEYHNELRLWLTELGRDLPR